MSFAGLYRERSKTAVFKGTPTPNKIGDIVSGCFIDSEKDPVEVYHNPHSHIVNTSTGRNVAVCKSISKRELNFVDFEIISKDYK
jgi:hypothetical protein